MSGRPRVMAVAFNPAHGFSKTSQQSIRLLEGRGVEGDAHCGAAVQHRWSARKSPSRPNLRQVHLLESEVAEELSRLGFKIGAGDLGENILTTGMALTALSSGTRLGLGSDAIVEVTGLREPCVQIERFWRGLRTAASVQGRDGIYVKGGIMAVVIKSGTVSPGDFIQLAAVPERFVPLPVL